MPHDHLKNSSRRKRAKVGCPALYALKNWADLPKTKRQMFEVEASQIYSLEHLRLLDSSFVEQEISSKYDAAVISSLVASPELSANLRGFLIASF